MFAFGFDLLLPSVWHYFGLRCCLWVAYDFLLYCLFVLRVDNLFGFVVTVMLLVCCCFVGCLLLILCFDFVFVFCCWLLF